MPVLLVLEPLVDHEDDVEDRGGEAGHHQGVVAVLRGGFLPDLAKNLEIYYFGQIEGHKFPNSD